MRVIQVTFDERLLARLDADEEVKLSSRSEVMRRAVAAYLRDKRRTAIQESYRKGYGQAGAPEFEGWVGEGTWPDE